MGVADMTAAEYWEVVESDGHYTTTDGVVHHFIEYKNGDREEWAEPLCDSSVRGLFSDWVWDLLDEPLDPRLIRRPPLWL